MNGSVVTAKIAGIESTANTTSVDSTVTSTMAMGVNNLLPSMMVVKRPPTN